MYATSWLKGSPGYIFGWEGGAPYSKRYLQKFATVQKAIDLISCGDVYDVDLVVSLVIRQVSRPVFFMLLEISPLFIQNHVVTQSQRQQEHHSHTRLFIHSEK